MAYVFGWDGTVHTNFWLKWGSEVRYVYWWDDKPLGNGSWLAAIHPPTIRTFAPPLHVSTNGLWGPMEGVRYYADIKVDSQSYGAVFRLEIGKLY